MHGYVWLSIALTGLWVSADAEERYAEEREQFRAAYAAVGTTNEDRDSRALRRYALYSYLQSARLAHALRDDAADGRTDERVAEFLERHDGEPVSRALRRAWLQSFARRQEWQSFVAHYRDGGDAVLQCQHLNARIALSGAGAEDAAAVQADIEQRWLTPRRLPPECESAFAWLRDRGALDSGLTEQRVRLLLQAGQAAFARVVGRRLPPDRAAPLNRWADLIEQPARTLDALLADPALPIEPDALLDGFRRLARANPLDALERWPALAERQLDAAAVSRHALALALGLAWDRRPEALELFAQVEPTDKDDYALSWQTRAALWNGDWPLVERTIAAMSPAERDHARWRYWTARAVEQRGDSEAAATLYREILPRDNFYSAQAAARLGRDVVPHLDPLPHDGSVLEALAEREFFVRARELLAIGWRSEALAEWLAGLAMLDAQARPQAIHLAADWNWHDVAIATATRQSVFFDYALLYPMPYDREVSAAAAAAGLSTSLVYGLIRQESLFRPDARSAAGAVGLAQLIPDTARIVARMAAEPAPSIDELLDPERNVRFGATYLRNLLERFGGQLPVALAAYNAGPLAAGRWLPSAPLEADVWIENIPFNETREYVQRVLWHSLVFAWRTSGEPQDAGEWPSLVVPLDAPAVASGTR